MKHYEPEILMGLILCLTLLLIVQSPRPAQEAPAPVLANMTNVYEPASFDRTQTVRLKQSGEVRELTIREYLIGVVMSEMPMSYEPEALKAQAIASRTYALHCRKHADADVCADGACCQCWSDGQSLRERFGADYETLREKAEQAVDSTDALVLKYRGSLIDATYFACSGGMTEDAVEVWGREVPYLRPVASPGEDGSCQSLLEYSPEEFAERIRSLTPEAELEGAPEVWLGEAQRTAGDGVRTMVIGETELTGLQLRNLFDLSSTKFTLTWNGECFCFDVCGAGHRVGMSQRGAQAMALVGATAEQILQTYYTGVEISHI